jgi:hypothetical protein
VVLRFGFLKGRSTFLRWLLSSIRLISVLTDAPATRRHWFLLCPLSTRLLVELFLWHMDLTHQRDPSSQLLILQFFRFYCCFYGLLSYLGYCLLLGETFVFEFVLVLFFTVVSIVIFNSIFSSSASFGWLLIPSEDIDRLVLFCIHFAYETTLRGPLKRLGHFMSHFLPLERTGSFYVQFPTFYIYFSTVLISAESIVGEPTHFSFIGSATSSSFRIRSDKDPPL